MRWIFRFCVLLLFVSLFIVSCSSSLPSESETVQDTSFVLAKSLPAEPGAPGESKQEASIAGRAFYAELGQLGYADPGNIFTINKDSLEKGESLVLSVNENFIYKYYYLSVAGKWEKYVFPQQVIGNTNWIEFAAGASVSTTDLPEGDNYVVVYSCSKTTTGFDCHNNKWQIHQFVLLAKKQDLPEEPQVLPTGPQCGSDQECPLDYACVNYECLPKPSMQPPSLEPAPEVFNTKFYQSPVFANADDLLNIPGYGFQKEATVVYKQVSDKPVNLQAPATIPNTNIASEGTLSVVNVNTDTLTVLLPGVIAPQKTYALWIKNKNSSWSEPVLINDPRPLWITPDL